MNSDGNTEAPGKAITRSVTGLIHDVTTLSELQAKLLAADLKEMAARILWPAVAMVAGAALIAACAPIGLAGLALLLTAAGLHPGAAFLIIAAGGVAVGAVAAVVAWSRVRDSLTIIERSQKELACNLNWFKCVVKSNER